MAQPDVVPVQHMEFDEYVVQPNMEVIEFDDFVIEGYVDVLEFDEYVIIAQADEADDGDGENIDAMNAHWCDIWPDKCNNKGDDDDEDQGGEEEEGC